MDARWPMLVAVAVLASVPGALAHNDVDAATRRTPLKPRRMLEEGDRLDGVPPIASQVPCKPSTGEPASRPPATPGRLHR